ncbi:hypothetical protein OQA88_9193 [Cercophora sp. LCS_1]
MAPRTAKEKPIFENLVIALAGTLGGQWTDTNIIRWVQLREGSYSDEMNETVTHLVCSYDEFKTRGPRVKKALKLGYKACKIVTKDWLEDSMTKKRRLPEKGYALDTELKKERAKKKAETRHQRGIEQAVRAVNSNLYHHYHDSTFFRYEVTISKEDGARYVMSLYESNAKPHLYWFVAKFYKRKGDSQPHFYRPSATPQLFKREFTEFETFFYKKTGVKWEQRLVRPAGMGPVGRLFFRYEIPKGGKPVGYVPEKFMPIEEEEEVKEDESETNKENEEKKNNDDEVDVSEMIGEEQEDIDDGLQERTVLGEMAISHAEPRFVLGEDFSTDDAPDDLPIRASNNVSKELRFALSRDLAIGYFEEETTSATPGEAADVSPDLEAGNMEEEDEDEDEEDEEDEEDTPMVVSDLPAQVQNKTPGKKLARTGRWRPVRLVANYISESARLWPAGANQSAKGT